MKIRETHELRSLPRARLYYEDVEALVAAFVEAGFPPSLESSNIHFDSLAELPKAGQQLSELEISSHDRRVNLRIGERSYFHSPDTILHRGLFDTCREIFEARRIASPTFGAGASAWAISVGAIFLFRWAQTGELVWQRLWLWGFLCFYPVLFTSLAMDRVVRPKILTATKASRPPFWVRRQDEIVLALLSAIVGAIVSALLLTVWK